LVHRILPDGAVTDASGIGDERPPELVRFVGGYLGAGSSPLPDLDRAG
jgi:hypothetical protein